LKLGTIIPVKNLEKGKERLSSVLNKEGRIELSSCMLKDVLKAVTSAKEVEGTVVISSDQDVIGIADEYGVHVIKEDNQVDVNKSIISSNSYLLGKSALSTLVLPSDIPLIRPENISELFESLGRKPSVVIVPSKRGDGTNALLRKPPGIIPTSFDRMSLVNHIFYMKQNNIHYSVLRIESIMLDLDLPQDIISFLKNKSDTKTYHFLRKIGLDMSNNN
jgi:2-phospho-L-lactate guanylyltransferase